MLHDVIAVIDELFQSQRNPITDGPNIGVRWQGGKLFEHDQKRTLPIKQLHAKLSDLGGRLFSLQKESDDPCPDGMRDLRQGLESWEDTVAIISLLDCVFTSCTAVAHIAGALGVPVYVMVPIVPYFIWAEEGRKSKWYDSARVFRQESGDSWSMPMILAKNCYMKGSLTKGS